jgi:hypothetical protein
MLWSIVPPTWICHDNHIVVTAVRLRKLQYGSIYWLRLCRYSFANCWQSSFQLHWDAINPASMENSIKETRLIKRQKHSVQFLSFLIPSVRRNRQLSRAFLGTWLGLDLKMLLLSVFYRQSVIHLSTFSLWCKTNIRMITAYIQCTVINMNIYENRPYWNRLRNAMCSSQTAYHEIKAIKHVLTDSLDDALLISL